MKQNFNTRLLPKTLTCTLGETKVGKTLASLAKLMTQEEHAQEVATIRRNYEVFDRYKAVSGIRTSH